MFFKALIINLLIIKACKSASCVTIFLEHLLKFQCACNIIKYYEGIHSL